ncbi:MAG: SEC-C domain-containing protein [Pirellulales bacterium]
MVESIQDRYARWQLHELLRRHPELRIVPADDLLVLRGDVAFRVVGPNEEYLEDSYRVEIVVPLDFPESVPMARERGGRIPATYHKLEEDFLCLAAPTELRIKLLTAPSLLIYVETYLIPYLYGYSYFAKHGRMPFGELKHGDDGIRQYLAGLFQSEDSKRAEDFVRCAAMKKRRANKVPCPCGSGQRLGRCHNRVVNSLRKRFGRKWFWTEYGMIMRSLSEKPRKDAVSKWLEKVPVAQLPPAQYGAA